jgi:ATP-dependent DNA helicase RecQ
MSGADSPLDPADALGREIEGRFGYPPRPEQRRLIERVLSGESSLGIMPTGSGKSLAFQASAALLPGTVLVVSPLLSLMRDQVEKLNGRLRAARLDSTLDRAETSEVLSRLASGQLDLLYVAPERLANERFRRALGRTRVAALAVDEAHCISAWGHDFRPDYLRLPLLRTDLGSPPVLALTATATPAVQRDIRRDLDIPDEGVINTGARRPNLAVRVELPADREARLRALVLEEPTAPTIVYALRQADTVRLADRLQQEGVAAAAYHAGLDDELRAEVQDRFLRDELACVVATIAFGMGVDKPNVRRVFHAHAPRSLEGYWQEIGRAGRDGAPAQAALLYDDSDLTALANFVDARRLSVEQIRGALNQAFTARESASVIAFSPMAVGDEHDMDPQALRTLLARLELRGVVRALTPTFDSYQLPISADQQPVVRALGPEEGPLWRDLVAGAKVGRTWRTLNLTEVAAAIGVPLARARQVIRRVEEGGLTELRTAGVLHRYEILRRPERESDLPALLEAVQEALEGEHRRLAAVRAFVLAAECRVSCVLEYLGDTDTASCGICDLCRGAQPTQREMLRRLDWRSLIDATEIRSMAALGSAGPDAVGVARGLCQVSTPRSRPYRRHPAWGRLERAPYDEVLETVVAALA